MCNTHVPCGIERPFNSSPSPPTHWHTVKFFYPLVNAAYFLLHIYSTKIIPHFFFHIYSPGLAKMDELPRAGAQITLLLSQMSTAYISMEEHQIKGENVVH